jgi:hypothetical protein
MPSSSVIISSVNYNGQTGNITFTPWTGNTIINLGTRTIPYSYDSNYVYGTYNIFYPFYNKTCQKIISPPNQVLPCDILTLFNYTDPEFEFEYSYIRRYDFPSNTSNPLGTQIGRASNDIAHTSNKLWFRSYGFLALAEFNITSTNPWTTSFNRTITMPVGSNYVGLSAIDNTNLLTVNAATTPNTIVRVNITTTTAAQTVIGSLPVDRQIIGDITLTSTNKMLVTNQTTTGFDNVYLTQYNYLTGAFEGEFSIIGQVPAPEGIFVQNNEIYIMNQGGQVYKIMKTSPYTLTYIQTDPEIVTGVSQRLECVNQNFTFGSWYRLTQCPAYEVSQFELTEPLEFTIPIYSWLPSGIPSGTVIKGTDGVCYSLSSESSIFPSGPKITKYGSTNYASCSICNNRVLNVYVSTKAIFGTCGILGTPNTTYLTYRINGGPWITGTTPVYPNHGTPYTTILSIVQGAGNVIEFYFNNIRWGVGFNSGDYTSRCGNQTPYTYTVPFSLASDVYLNINTSTTFDIYDNTVCSFVPCPGYIRPNPYEFRNQTYTPSLYELNYNYYELNYNIPFENIYTLAYENIVWAESNAIVNSKNSYEVPSPDYTSIISYVWYDPTTNLWTESSALGGGLIYTTLNSLDNSEPVSGPENPWISTPYVINSTIIGSEPKLPIITTGLVLWYDAGTTLSWPGSGTVLNDITGNNTGTFYSNLVITPPTFLVSNMGAFQFVYADNDAISCGNGPTLSGITNVVTVEGWFKPSALNDGNLFSKNGNQGFRVRIDSNGTLYMVGAKSGPSLDDFSSTGTVTVNTWSHIVAVWTSTGYYTYINGVNAGFNLSKTFLVQNNTNPLLIGQTSGSSERYSGLGSIFRVYNRALSASEVLSNFNSEKSRFGL